MASDRPHTLLIGLGNPGRRDDEVGLHVVRLLRPLLAPDRFTVLEASRPDFRLLEVLAGYERAILVEAVQLGGLPGQLHRLPPEQLRNSEHPAAPHDVGLPDALAQGAQLGTGMAREVTVYGIEALHLTGRGAELTPDVAAAVPQAVAAILQELDPDLTGAIREALSEGRLSCQAAFAVAKARHQPPRQLAARADAMGIRISSCQLGLFGGKKGRDHEAQGEALPIEAEQQILAWQEKGGLPCARAWAMAKRLGVERLEVGRTADLLGVRIVHCQLGCFP